ncbi:hypothetical protein PENFLA_c015G03253 [Penicillium flavigenum]|uniref:Uncharacterized protein n=1 Tax=Penicillium flavigenum TaxID=254877 RepID=A0A1V6T4B8_9EURO|nr:hypothetical protein PENFLA_c015G03253 [Penicillium flavigenum]
MDRHLANDPKGRDEVQVGDQETQKNRQGFEPDIHLEPRDTALRELRELLADSDVEDEGDWERDVALYGVYHSYCVVTHLFIEDEEALDGGGLLHLFLDDCGNVVRQWRTENDGGDDNYDGAWKSGMLKEAFTERGKWVLIIVPEE